MADFPTTTEELEEYISDYMDAHIAERIAEVTTAQISEAVTSYMQELGAAIEDNGVNGDVPLVADNALDADNTAIPLARLSNGVPTSFFQARVRALAIAAAQLITHADVAMPVTEHDSSDTELSIGPNVLHAWESIESLEITSFAGAKSGKVNEYLLQFMVGSSSFSLTLPSSVIWAEEQEWEAGYTYQVSIVNNLAIAAIWEGEAEYVTPSEEPDDSEEESGYYNEIGNWD